MNDTHKEWCDFVNRKIKITQSEWIQFWYIINYVTQKKNNWKILSKSEMDKYLTISFHDFMEDFNLLRPKDYICKCNFDGNINLFDITLNDYIIDDVFKELEEKVDHNNNLKKYKVYYAFTLYLRKDIIKELLKIYFNIFYEF